jgi:DNA repair protein RecN (Recombination protein N)
VLKELRIRNLAVVESLTVPFAPGLNVLTGETGAGKSILIEALTLLLGERVQPGEAIREGADTAVIEGVFSLPKKSPVPALLQEHGFAAEDGQLIVRRELVRGARGRVFLNDGNATLALVERLAEVLVEVHGQHEFQSLLKPGRHLDLLDAFGGLGILRDRLRQRYDEWKAASAELRQLRETARDKFARIERLRQDIDEIDGARLRRGEEEEVREERRRLQNAERLAEGANLAYRALYDEGGAAVPQVGRATTTLRDLAKIDASLAPTVAALEQAGAELDEAVRALRGYRDAIVFDPPRLEEIERRLDEIGRLKRKHGESVEAVLGLRDRLGGELDGLTHGDEDASRLTDRVDQLRAELQTRAADLSARREQVLGRLEGLTQAELTELDLEQAIFKVRLTREAATSEDEIRVGPDEWRVGPRGVDHAEFLFSANPGESPKPLARIASGGELSRTMLALKVVLAAADAVPILVFDEVDVGIGGKTADAVGRKLRQVARARQVLCVTHLPQIASYAEHHLRVEKREEGGRMVTQVSPLAKQERIREVARMLGGESVTDTSLQHALELINSARGR